MSLFAAFRKFFPILLLSALCACAGGDRFESRPVGFSDLSGWQQEDHLQAVEVFKKSCPALVRKSRPETSGSGIAIDPALWNSLCSEADGISSPAQAKEFFERRFAPYRIANNGKEKGLFTGYYEPVLYGSTKKKGDFKYPLYSAPPELASSKPYYTRAEINSGALNGRGLEIAWVDDPVMLFFMQIQGSGRVKLTNGKELRLGYADQNGQQYVSLGKVMEDNGYIKKGETNFFTIRDWLYKHPKQAQEVMENNPSYVFFKIMSKPEVVGSIGVPLTPQRSIAIDSSHIPYGLPVYMETDIPTRNGSAPLKRIMLAQDTGGAIKSPVRADIFFGAGADAEYMAGYMRGQGVYSLLVPKEIISQMR